MVFIVPLLKGERCKLLGGTWQMGWKKNHFDHELMCGRVCGRGRSEYHLIVVELIGWRGFDRTIFILCDREMTG